MSNRRATGSTPIAGREVRKPDRLGSPRRTSDKTSALIHKGEARVEALKEFQAFWERTQGSAPVIPMYRLMEEWEPLQTALDMAEVKMAFHKASRETSELYNAQLEAWLKSRGL